MHLFMQFIYSVVYAKVSKSVFALLMASLQQFIYFPYMAFTFTPWAAAILHSLM